MQIFFGSDHAGFDLKEELISFVEGLGFTVHDLGASEKVPEDDYPDFVAPVAKKVAATVDARGIVIGGSGQGEAMVANRVQGVRAALYYGGPREILQLSRQHNDANVLSLGARFLTVSEAKDAVRLWLETDFSHEPRHERRIAKIDGENA